MDILLRIEFLNGRIVQSTLSPARPIFVVPSPPTVVHTLNNGYTSGIQGILAKIIVLVLICILFPAAPAHKWVRIGIVYIGGLGAGLVLQLNNLLLFQDPYLHTILLGLVVTVSVLRLRDMLPAYSITWLFLSLFIGLASGAGLSLPDAEAGLTSTEYGIWILCAMTGIMTGLVVFIAAGYHLSRAREIRRVDGKATMKWLWYVIGIVTCAMLVYDATLYLV